MLILFKHRVRQQIAVNTIKNLHFAASTSQQHPSAAAVGDATLGTTTVKNYKEIPRVKNIPFLGTTIPFLTGKYNSSNYTELIAKRFETYGTIYREKFVFDTEKVYTCEPKDWEILFKSHEKEINAERKLWPFEKYTELHKTPLSYASLDGDDFLRRRDAMAKSFLQPKKLAKYIPMYSDAMDDFLVMFDEVLMKKNGKITGIKDLLCLWQVECFGMHSFRHRFGFVTETDMSKIDPDMVRLLENAKKSFALFAVLFLKSSHSTKSNDWKLFEECSMEIYDSIKRLLLKYPQHLSDPSSNITDEDVLTMLVDSIRAGVDTVFNTINWALVELSKNPDVQDKLYQEIHEILAKEPQISYAQLQKLPYLRGTIKEIFRVRPLVPLNGKKIKEDLVLSGYRIPAGTEVLASFFYYDKERYFLEPNRMKPERWMKSEERKQEVCPITGDKKEAPNKFTIMPFGHGPRACIGRRIAESQLLVFVSKFVNKYKILPLEEELRSKTNIFLVVDGDVEFRFERR